ncbi:MAG: sporulation integral membrane protein YtvI [Clostridia bacterium]
MSEKWLKAELIAKKLVITTILIGGCILGFYLIPKVFALTLPFIVAYIIYLVASPVTRLLRKAHMPSMLSAIISILLVAGVLFGVTAAIVGKVVDEIYTFSQALPELYQSVSETLWAFQGKMSNMFELLPVELFPHTPDIIDAIGKAVTSLSSTVVEFITVATINTAKHIPSVLVSVVFSILASYFLICDSKKVKAALKGIVGENIYSKASEMKRDLSNAAFAYIRAQGILMCITFVEVFIGLSILGVKYSFLFAIIIALVDAIPVFGTGTIVIPWAILSLITGNFQLAVGLAIIYVVCLIVRQFLEPKILSSQIGIHPLLTIFSMYVGFRTIGMFGMILGPVIAIIAKNFLEKYQNIK